MIQEKVFRPMTGWLPLVVVLMMLIGSPLLIIYFASTYHSPEPYVFAFLFTFFTSIVMRFGFQAVAPNNARALLLFGDYKGSITESGFFWVNPFYSKKKISLRVRNFETGALVTPETKNEFGKVIQKATRTAVQGQRSRRQSHRNLGRRCLESR